jgi:hypothetical protein
MKRKAVKKGRKRPSMTMHCSRCKFISHTGIKGMGAHYRKKHPKAMKRK